MQNVNKVKSLNANKDVVALRVCRKDKKYHENPFINAQMNLPNHNTYILIRNGHEVYRIWGDITITRLFPKSTELQELKDRWDEIVSKDEAAGGGSIVLAGDERIWGDDIEKAKDKIEDNIFRYKQQFILLQGLLDRTEILHPIPEPIKLLSDETIKKGLVKFIYDDEKQIASGRKSFREYFKEINSQIKEGSKVLVVMDKKLGFSDEYRSDTQFVQGRGYRRTSDHRFDDRYTSEYASLPNDPQTGIYTVYHKNVPSFEEIWSEQMPENEGKELSEKLKKSPEYKYRYHGYSIGQLSYPNYMTDDRNGKTTKNRKVVVLLELKPTIFNQPIIKYNPKDEIINYWNRYDDGHDRKNRLSWEIYPESDSFIFNYDLIDIDEILYYMLDRTNRKDYLTMMPVLKEVYDRKLAEAKKEEDFIKLIANQFKTSNPEKCILMVKQCVTEFKTKVKWKRSIDDNDEKSWSIIKKNMARKLQALPKVRITE